MTTIVLEDAVDGRRTAVTVRRLMVAGYTGRDPAAVARHVEELAAAGVPRPPSTPTCYILHPSLVTQAPVVVVGPHSSGEVEPVLVVAGGRRLLTVGSDHTDRRLERQDVASAKAACPKVVGTTAVDSATLTGDAWDDVRLRSVLADGTPYQQGTLAELLHPDDLLRQLPEIDLAEGDVLFLGTVPAIGGLRPSPAFTASLELPGGPSMALSYRTVGSAAGGGRPMAKPEIEFTSVDQWPWVPVAGIPGQAERILATDAGSGLATRMLRFDPGCDTSTMGVLRHDFWEEVHILSGSLHDLTLGQVFGAGTFACRPPGMPHGPWRSPDGCVTFEVRYPAR